MCNEFKDDSSYQGLDKLHYIQSNTNHRDVQSASARSNVDGAAMGRLWQRPRLHAKKTGSNYHHGSAKEALLNAALLVWTQ